jgi:hypothetical protein
MRRSAARTATAATFSLGLISVASSAAAMEIPEIYMTGRPPAVATKSTPQKSAAPKTAAVEKAQTDAPLFGSFYSEVFPLFNEGFTGNTSYLRLGTTSSTSSTFGVIVVGSPSGSIYGEGDVTVPANSVPQYSITELYNAIGGVASLADGDTGYALYLSNDDGNSFFQHVIYNGTNNFFEDMTICIPAASMQGDRTVTNIHTSIIPGFPSTVYVHNYLDVPADYRVVVRSSRTGQIIGTITSLQASTNATYQIPFSFFQQQVNWTPTATQQHATLEFHATAAFAVTLGAGADPTDLGGVFAQSVKNNTYNAVLNLSNKCRMVR